jgi:hypothetical protein
MELLRGSTLDKLLSNVSRRRARCMPLRTLHAATQAACRRACCMPLRLLHAAGYRRVRAQAGPGCGVDARL